MNNTDESGDSGKLEFIKKAVGLTRLHCLGEPEKGNEPYAAVVVKDGKIIAKGWNRITEDHDPSCHGEVDAIRKACKALKTSLLEGCDMYTSCEPCSMCFSLITLARMNKVYYAQKFSNFPLEEQVLYTKMAKDCSQPVDKRSMPYEHLPSAEEEANEIWKTWYEAK